ncbi:low temperature requirement protein A [Antribacter sp. KLBMP9083]|uniref:Low temperature requirement protein A n=1 Tax=Antribacter soli TaxID=2910976 RepID=A0AA41QF33_9MICO|nr:low temperature requirement protein A [Antribacter soli]MCF4122275.1 low temperature requirement protein A [Antribacter soli]
MTSEPAPSSDPADAAEVARPEEDAGTEKRVAPLELFFDLVFVFAITQVTARLADHVTWDGMLHGLLILGAIWWAWGAYAWLTNEVDGSRNGVRLAMFGSMAGMLVAALAIPRAFEENAVVFAGAYLVVRALHVALFVTGTVHVDVRTAARTLAPTALLAPVVLLVAVLLDDWALVALWVVALGIDYIGGGLRGIEGWRLSPGHFAERHGLIIIIALGESIFAIGVGAAGLVLDAATIAAGTLGIGVVAVLWATYFDQSTEPIETHLHALRRRDRNTTARDAYSFLHLPMVAGIVLLALGIKKTIEHVGDPLGVIPSAALGGGVALYLAAQVAYRRRVRQPTHPERLVAALACAALVPLLTVVPAIAGLAALAGVCAALYVYELVRGNARAALAS